MKGFFEFYVRGNGDTKQGLRSATKEKLFVTLMLFVNVPVPKANT